MAFAIAALLDTGMKQHRIAALLHVNQGRVSEVKTGKIYPEFTRKRFKRS
ncbi:MAG: hypothetical protein VYD64_02575 [Pseudomonadota bacterium]|nr:hypothetical protein [Pseudomonadota bacterium]